MANQREPKQRTRPKDGEPVERYGRAVRVALLVIPIIATLALLWIGAESHYRSCVAAAEAANTVQVLQDPKGSMIVGQRARADAVDDCSRLPF